MKQKMSGFSYYRVNIDGSVEDNSDMYDDLMVKNCWKKYRCENCGSVLPVTGVIKEFQQKVDKLKYIWYNEFNSSKGENDEN